MKKQKTAARIAVENAMREHATPETPLKSERIAELSGLNLTLTRHYLSLLMRLDMIYNVGKRATSAYVWREPAAKEITPSVSRFSAIPYLGEKATFVRPGAMDAYQIPSLVGGECVERKRPLLNGGSLA